MIIRYTSLFEKHFKKLPPHVKALVVKKQELFREDPRTPVLQTHPLTKELKGYWAFRIKYHYRIMFTFEEDGSVTFNDIGTHSIYE